MKQTFGFLFVLSLFHGFLNPFDAPLWGRALPPLLILGLQALVVGKGMKKVGEFTSELEPVESLPSEVSGSCRWELFEDGSWMLHAEMESLPKELAFEQGSVQKFDIVVGEKTIPTRWVRTELSVPESYGFRASLEGKSPTPKQGDVFQVVRQGQPFLSGALQV